MKYHDVEDFVHVQLELLNLERDAEIAATRQLRENVSAKVLQQNGVCLTQLSLSNVHSGLYGRSMATFIPGSASAELPATRLASGDIVGIFLNSSSTQLEKDQLCSGVVSRLKAKSLEVALDSAADESGLDEDSSYKIVKLANDITYRRLKEGLDRLKNAPGRARVLLSCVFDGRDFSPPAASLPPPLVAPASSAGPSAGPVWFNERLDESQKQAVEHALKQRELAVIHGPPGTGKTTTVAEVILQHVKAGKKVLACAPSNVAVDNLLEKLLFHRPSVRAVRLGHPTRMQETIQNRSLDAILQASDSHSIVRDVRRDLDAQLKQLTARGKGASRRGGGAVLTEIRSLRQELRQRESQAVRQTLGAADVVLTTLTSAAAGHGPLRHLPDGHFDYVVVDECSQATEAACWLALTWAERALLAGDHHQLPPTIVSVEAQQRGLDLTLMERILKRPDGPTAVRMLQVQYRMHADIMNWSSSRLYGGQLKAAAAVERHLLCHLPGVEETEDTALALLLIDTAGCDHAESAVSDQGSKANAGEAALTDLHVRRLVEAGVRPQQIAVVTPYNLQVELLRQLLSSDYPDLEIRTVDGFQGREMEAVVLSLVRSNTCGQVGFVADVRRLNVAVTRARRHLCVITDSATTGRASHGLVDHLEQHGEVRSAHEYAHQLQNQVFVKDAGASTSKSTGRPKETAPSTPANDAELETKLEAEIQRWSRGAASSQPLSFPTSLTSFGRRIVHQIAERLGLQHESVGVGPDRRVIVQKSKNVPTEPLDLVAAEGSDVPADSNAAEGKSGGDRASHLAPAETVDVTAAESFPGATTSTGRQRRAEKKKKTPANSVTPVISTTSATSMTSATSTTSKTSKTSALSTNSTASVAASAMCEICVTCRKSIPVANVTLHRLHCQRRCDPQPKASGGGMRPKVKPTPDADDEAKLMEEFQRLDAVCSFNTCRTRVTLLRQQCTFCRRNFCLNHHMAEVHGCGVECRRQARADFIGSGAGAGRPASGSAPLPLDAGKRAQLQRRLDRKIDELGAARAGPKQNKPKKK